MGVTSYLLPLLRANQSLTCLTGRRKDVPGTHPWLGTGTLPLLLGILPESPAEAPYPLQSQETEICPNSNLDWRTESPESRHKDRNVHGGWRRGFRRVSSHKTLPKTTPRGGVESTYVDSTTGGTSRTSSRSPQGFKEGTSYTCVVSRLNKVTSRESRPRR